MLRLVKNLLLGAAIWWLLAGGSSAAWLVGVPAVLAAAGLSQWLGGGNWRLSAMGAVRFVPTFLRHSLLGGVDVARRALIPRLPIAPELVEYRLRLPAGPARVFFVGLISLLPGTLSARLRRDVVLVHTIDAQLPVGQLLRDLELSVARLFAVGLPPAADR